MTAKVLCIGHGPSRYDRDIIEDFDGLLLSVDASTTELFDDGIIPDYSLYSETGHTVIRNLEYFMPDYMSKYDVKIVYKDTKMTYIFAERLKELGLKSKGFDGRYGVVKNHITQAVGLYTIAFADMILRSDEIHLIGYDYKGIDNDGRDMCETWKLRTIHYLKSRRNAGYNARIIDHSGGNFPTL